MCYPDTIYKIRFESALCMKAMYKSKASKCRSVMWLCSRLKGEHSFVFARVVLSNTAIPWLNEILLESWAETS